MGKRREAFDARAVWLEALLDFENELHEHVERAMKDQLRFQDGRLFASLTKHIKAKATGKWKWLVMFELYQFMTDPSLFPGYDEARRLHGEEMLARGLASAREFCSGMPKRFAVKPEAIFLEELRSRVRSVAAWMECQESFGLWLVFRDFRSGWRGSGEERARAVVAINLSQLHKNPAMARVRTRYAGRPWSDAEWANIQKQAARLTKKRYDCTEFDRWLWWAMPVARRYRWNTRELQDVACARGFVQAREMYEENFRRHMLTMGLCLSGRKKARGSVPPLSKFVLRMMLPDPATMWGEVGGFLTKKKR